MASASSRKASISVCSDLAMISEMTDFDPESLQFEDEPKTWDEAKDSPDAALWEAGYKDELKSLKDIIDSFLNPMFHKENVSEKENRYSTLNRTKWDRQSNGKYTLFSKVLSRSMVKITPK
jgi:hypothetical protein